MLRTKKELLLHVCCAPCATSVFEALADEYWITAYFYNPNIQPLAEYQKRREQVELLCRRQKIQLLIPDYDDGCWLSRTAGLEHEPEGGARCSRCYELRIARAFEAAISRGAAAVATTLSVSPHKNARLINEIGLRASGASNIAFLERDFKKGGGYQKSCELSRRYGLYRQNYCGCFCSMAKNRSHEDTGRKKGF